MDAFAALAESLAAAPARVRAQRLDQWLSSVDEASRDAARSLLSRTVVSVPPELVARLPDIEPAERSLSLSEAVAILDALADERSPARKLELLEGTLRRLTAASARCFLALAIGTLRLDERAGRPRLGTLAVVVTSVSGRQATLAVRGRDGYAEVGRALLPDDQELASLVERLVIEREGARRWLRPEIVLEVSFEAVRRDARWSSGYALTAPTTLAWLADRQPFAGDMIERVEAFLEQSKAKAAPRASAPPPPRTRRHDDLPLFGGSGKATEE